MLRLVCINAHQGSVFVEYKDKTNAANLMAKDEVKYNDIVLLKEYKYVTIL